MYLLYIDKEPQLAQRQREIVTVKQERQFPLPEPEPVKPVVSRDRYYGIFNSDFIGFGLPRTDTCVT